MRGAATQAMPLCIVEERQQSRCPPAAAPLRAAARRPAGFVARSSRTAPGIVRRSRLASGPGGQQQSVQVISSQTLSRHFRNDELDEREFHGEKQQSCPRACSDPKERFARPAGVLCPGFPE